MSIHTGDAIFFRINIQNKKDWNHLNVYSSANASNASESTSRIRRIETLVWRNDGRADLYFRINIQNKKDWNTFLPAI